MKSLIHINLIIVPLLYAILWSATSACENRSFGQRADSLFLIGSGGQLYYDLKNPDEKHFLPYVLEEISGLTYLDNDLLLAIDDEAGRVFEYDLNSREIKHSIKFHKPDDYEGIEVVNDTIYVLKSDGDIFEFPYTDKKEAKAIKYENALEKENDAEGLGYNPLTHNLVISCKEKAGLEGKKIKGRAVYAFSLREKKLLESPAHIVSKEHLETFWEKNKSMDYDGGRIKFKPSAIAFHPIEKVFYVLASVGKLIVVVDRTGEIIATYPVYPRLLSQPEGLCFAPNGDMFISSEGEGDRGYILKYKARTKR